MKTIETKYHSRPQDEGEDEEDLRRRTIAAARVCDLSPDEIQLDNEKKSKQKPQQSHTLRPQPIPTSENSLRTRLEHQTTTVQLRKLAACEICDLSPEEIAVGGGEIKKKPLSQATCDDSAASPSPVTTLENQTTTVHLRRLAASDICDLSPEEIALGDKKHQTQYSSPLEGTDVKKDKEKDEKGNENMTIVSRREPIDPNLFCQRGTTGSTPDATTAAAVRNQKNSSPSPPPSRPDHDGDTTIPAVHNDHSNNVPPQDDHDHEDDFLLSLSDQERAWILGTEQEQQQQEPLPPSDGLRRQHRENRDGHKPHPGAVAIGAFAVHGQNSFRAGQNDINNAADNAWSDGDVDDYDYDDDVEQALVGELVQEEADQARALELVRAQRQRDELVGQLGSIVASGVLAEDVSDQIVKETRQTNRQYYAVLCLGCVLVVAIAAILMGVLLTQSGGESDSPRVTGPLQAFTTQLELSQAVDGYLDSDGHFQSVSAKMYGWPINSWNVSLVSDFSQLFSAKRNSLAGHFNESIEDWDTSSAVTMESMFEGAKAFNQPIPKWRVSLVANTARIFSGATSFHQDLSDWKTDSIENLEQAFAGATSFNGNVSTWKVDRVVTMRGLFKDAQAFNQDLSNWNTARLTDLSDVFRGATSFNGDISTWQTGRVTTMANAFSGAKSFAGDVSEWQVSSVTSLQGAFSGAAVFNSPIGEWDTTNVESMEGTFQNATLFSQPLASWKLDKTTTTAYMFDGARSFNQDISDWQTASVQRMEFIFRNAVAFNQPIGPWNVQGVQWMESCFEGATSFNHDLSSWRPSSVPEFRRMFLRAESFRQDLCPWWNRVRNTVSPQGMFVNMFQGTSCPQQGDPDRDASPFGPFCFECFG